MFEVELFFKKEPSYMTTVNAPDEKTAIEKVKADARLMGWNNPPKKTKCTRK